MLTQRALASLKRAGLVASRPRIIGGPEFGQGRPTYQLTADGVRAARALVPGMPSRRFRSSGAFLARHALAAAQVILGFRRAANDRADDELVTWESDWEAALPLGSSVLEPDAYVLYRVGDRRLHAFVEVDMGSESGRFVSQKMRRYLDVHRAGTWQGRLPVWPVILVVAPSDARVSQLRRLAQAISRSTDGTWDMAASFHLATLDAVIGADPLGPIWQVVEREGLHPLVPDRVFGTTQ